MVDDGWSHFISSLLYKKIDHQKSSHKIEEWERERWDW